MPGKEKNAVAGEFDNLSKQEVRARRCRYMVEANPFEQECLHQRFDAKFEEWKQLTFSVWGQDIGRIGKREKERVVCVMIDYAVINDTVVAFYHPTSRFVDHAMIEKYLKKQHPKAELSGDASSFFANVGRELLRDDK
jgi:hypothetical protein